METLQKIKKEFDNKYVNSNTYNRYVHNSYMSNENGFYLFVLLKEEPPKKLKFPIEFHGIRIVSKVLTLEDFL